MLIVDFFSRDAPRQQSERLGPETLGYPAARSLLVRHRQPTVKLLRNGCEANTELTNHCKSL